jgi:hypothetical protein
MKRPLRVLALLALFSVSARADTIYNNFGPSQTFQSSAGYNIENDLDGFAGLAVPFTAQADYANSTFTLPMFTINSGDFTVSLFSNASGQPGTVLDTSLFVSGNSFTQGMFTGSMGSLTAGTTYWLVVLPDSSDMLLFWNWNSTGDNGALASTLNGTTWNSSTGIRPAVEVDGTPVPEPGTLVLLATGLLGVAARFRKKRL